MNGMEVLRISWFADFQCTLVSKMEKHSGQI